MNGGQWDPHPAAKSIYQRMCRHGKQVLEFSDGTTTFGKSTAENATEHLDKYDYAQINHNCSAEVATKDEVPEVKPEGATAAGTWVFASDSKQVFPNPDALPKSRTIHGPQNLWEHLAAMKDHQGSHGLKRKAASTPTTRQPTSQGSMDVCTDALKKLKIMDRSPSKAHTSSSVPTPQLPAPAQRATVVLENGEAGSSEFKPQDACRVVDVQAKKC